MVRVTNREARAFYEKYGFRKVRTVRGYYEDGGDGWLMARTEQRG
jgi:ribosomal-protein-alanine N-acetyltransferase